MYSKKDIHDIAIDIFNNPNTVNNYKLNSEDLSRVSQSLYNISKINIEGKVFLKNIKEHAISFNEKEGLDIKPNEIEHSSHVLWYGYNGKEGLFNLVSNKDLLLSKTVSIDDILSKKTKVASGPSKKISSVVDLIQNAKMQANINNSNNNKDMEKGR